MSLAFPIVRESPRWLAINKPVGWLSTPPDHLPRDPRRGPLCVITEISRVFPEIARKFSLSRDAHLRSRGGAVHRIDRDTSGILLIAKDPAAEAAFEKKWERHQVFKHYWTIVCGHPLADEKDIRDPIYYIPQHQPNHEFVVNERRASELGLSLDCRREALTHYQVLERYRLTNGEEYSLLDVQTFTGRTHQIRFHLNGIGYPLLGERHYTDGTKSAFPYLAQQFVGQALHARSLSFDDPYTGEPVEMACDPLPLDHHLPRSGHRGFLIALRFLRGFKV